MYFVEVFTTFLASIVGLVFKSKFKNRISFVSDYEFHFESATLSIEDTRSLVNFDHYEISIITNSSTNVY